ncbi:MAG: nitronate monooxygenase [candidate division Zixibacteria bacterium]|nr:nitronate monooxygenase [candidate division Zixibacteria bacterium]
MQHINFKNMPNLQIGDLNAKVPIIQGGMGVGISLSGLASAVANEGGIGVIAAAGIGTLEPDYYTNFEEANRRALQKEIKLAKEKTDGIIGVNIMMALTDWDYLWMTALDAGADIVFLGAGLPLKYPRELTEDMFKRSTAKIIPIVSSARAVKIIFQYWAKHYNHIPDAIVVEGPMAGGHLGFKKEQIDNPDYTLDKILLQVINEVGPYEKRFDKKIPVIAAGGIYTGADINKYIRLGANGVQMATRFVTTYECDAAIEFKEMYIECKKDDITIIDSPVGLPGRAINNKFLDEVSSGIRKPFGCPWKCLKTCEYKKAPYCIALALTNAKKGKLNKGFAFAGANAYRAEKIISIKELFENISKEYEEAIIEQNASLSH